MIPAQEHADLVILGSGSTAFAAALHAAELGKTAIMIERRAWSTMPPTPAIRAYHRFSCPSGGRI